MTDPYLDTNRQVYDRMALANDPLCRPATDAEIANPLKTVDGAGWLGSSIRGKKLLCLAAGGGRQSSLYSAAGADVTVVDLSPAMLELDRQVAAERGYSLRLFETTMENLSMLGSGEFDIVIHPVSTCYVPDIAVVYRQVARIIATGGIYVSQHKQPTSLQATTRRNARGRYELEHNYYRKSPVQNPGSADSATRRLRETGATEYLHRWEQIIGEMCRSGFVIEDLSEPFHAETHAASNSFADRARYIAPYVRIKASRTGGSTAANEGTLWLPEQK